jgi:hypothetical protein
MDRPHPRLRADADRLWGVGQDARCALFGVTVATLHGVAQLLFIPACPFWSLTFFTLDILVIYGLIAHGKRTRV